MNISLTPSFLTTLRIAIGPPQYSQMKNPTTTLPKTNAAVLSSG
jgi:hypothetical protein